MQTQQTSSIDRDAVARKAYELWLQGGRREGVAEQNWKDAEHYVRSLSASVPQPPATMARKSDPPSAPRASSITPTSAKKSAKRH